MVLQTTNQPKRSEDGIKQAGVLPGLALFRAVVIQALKLVFVKILVRPATWRFLMVYVPNWFDRLCSLFDKILSFFEDFI